MPLATYERTVVATWTEGKGVDVEDGDWWIDVMTTLIHRSLDAKLKFGDEAEACGYIVQGGGHEYVRHCANLFAEEPGRFGIGVEDTKEIYGLLEDGCLAGVWHSHPDGSHRPSDDDLAGHPKGVPMYILVLDNLDSKATLLRFDLDYLED